MSSVDLEKVPSNEMEMKPDDSEVDEEPGQMSNQGTNGINGNGNSLEKRVRNNVALSTLDGNMLDALGSGLPAKYNLNGADIENLASEDSDFYVIDLQDLDVAIVRGQIMEIRQTRPDSEIFLLASESMMEDPLAPKLKVSMDRYLVSRVDRPGNGTSNEYGKVVRSIENRIIRYLNRPQLIKVGGSIWDLIEKDSDVLQRLLKEAKTLHGAGYPIILTTGGGPRLDTERTLNEGTGIPLSAERVLRDQAEGIKDLLGKVGQIIEPKDFRKDIHLFSRKSYLKEHIPIVYLSGEDTRATQSDAHSLMIGDRVKSYKLIFAKDTRGVYESDPNKPGEGRLLRVFHPSGDLIPVLYADQAINDISRRGRDGRGDHLVETDALVKLQHMDTKNVRAIHVVDGKDPMMLRYSVEGRRSTPDKNYVGSFILRGEAPITFSGISKG